MSVKDGKEGHKRLLEGYIKLHIRKGFSKDEIKKLAAIEAGRRLTIVPISVYIKSNRIKVSIASVRGKKKYDKRETTKRRESDREMGRVMKGH